MPRGDTPTRARVMMTVNLFRKNAITVATIEKANSLLCHYGARRGGMKDLACVVVDELHMIHEGDRGGDLECMLTKLRHMNRRVQVRAGGGAVHS